MNLYACGVCACWSYGDTCRVEVCLGNQARFERHKLRHGVRISYRGTAYRVDGTGRGGYLAGFLATMDRRWRGPELVEVRHAIRHEIQAYCLDAPNEMPAGACYWESVPIEDDPDPNPGYVAQLTVSREGGADVGG